MRGMDQDIVDEIAAAFWEQTAARFESRTDRHDAMMEAEEVVLDFQMQNPTLWKEHGLDPDKLAEVIAEQMP